MPEICRFLGIVITMYYKEHSPPHFHAKYAELNTPKNKEQLRHSGQEAQYRGQLPKRIVSLVLEWAFEHRDELLENWKLVERKEDLKKIRPLVQESSIMHWITDVSYLDGYKLKLIFENNECKLVDLQKHLDGKIFEPLKNISYFKSVTLNKDIDTIVWPNNADFSPDFLYEIGQPVNN